MAAKQITTEQFQEAIQGEKPVLVDFWAPWCVYCRRISAVYDKIAAEYAGRLTVVKVNIDEEARLAEQEGIDTIPTLRLYQNGEALDSIVAPASKSQIDEFIRETLGE